MSGTEEFQPIRRTEVCALGTARRIAAMLDLDPDRLREGDTLPRGWHFPMLAGETRRSELRGDGFPGLGVAIPDMGLSRLVLGGRRVTFLADIPIGAALQRTSKVASLTQKEATSGPMAFVTVEHSLAVAQNGAPAIVEEATYILLEAAASDRAKTVAAEVPDANIPGGDRNTIVIPDETLLFQYSALGFNSHKIHIDKAYARDVEGYPDLVVNGGLTTLLLSEFIRNDLKLMPRKLSVKHTAPLFCGNPITLTANHETAAWNLSAFAANGLRAAEMKLECQ
ncbi:FAS1-like dehydratase domain-containing protein [Nisaea denitrificans]|uniref:FAS1-like dehydratase domain-containing protein n=1 Tax=Nisaea denitrificans TaxID=390877 RepID=UPI00040CCC09|nr:MaoC family dehydratase N-terminal domain-containing protein [Nisaea denitrificans]